MLKERSYYTPQEADPKTVTEHENSRKKELANQVLSLMQKDPQPYDSDFLMQDIAGFNPVKFAARYLFLHEEATKKGYSLSEINSLFADMAESDLHAYAMEFLYRTPILQTEYEIRSINGIDCVVSPHYDPTSPLHTHIDLKERDGASFSQVLLLEQAILEARNHSTILYSSTKGWNGIGMPFEEGQMHVVNIVDNTIIDTVIRHSLSLEENKKLIEFYTKQTFKEAKEVELIKAITQSVIAFPFDLTPESVLTQMQRESKSSIAWNRMKLTPNKEVIFDRSFTYKHMQEVLQRESFLDTNKEVQTMIKQVAQFIQIHASSSPEDVRGLVRELGKTALIISESVGYETGEIKERTIHNGDYSSAKQYAAEALACDTPRETSALQSKYDAEGIPGICTQCGDSASLLCGWCIKCAKAGTNYKEKLTRVEQQNDEIPTVNSLLLLVFASLFRKYPR